MLSLESLQCRHILICVIFVPQSVEPQGYVYAGSASGSVGTPQVAPHVAAIQYGPYTPATVPAATANWGNYWASATTDQTGVTPYYSVPPAQPYGGYGQMNLTAVGPVSTMGPTLMSTHGATVTTSVGTLMPEGYVHPGTSATHLPVVPARSVMSATVVGGAGAKGGAQPDGSGGHTQWWTDEPKNPVERKRPENIEMRTPISPPMPRLMNEEFGYRQDRADQFRRGGPCETGTVPTPVAEAVANVLGATRTRTNEQSIGPDGTATTNNASTNEKGDGKTASSPLLGGARMLERIRTGELSVQVGQNTGAAVKGCATDDRTGEPTIQVNVPSPRGGGSLLISMVGQNNNNHARPDQVIPTADVPLLRAPRVEDNEPIADVIIQQLADIRSVQLEESQLDQSGEKQTSIPNNSTGPVAATANPKEQTRQPSPVATSPRMSPNLDEDEVIVRKSPTLSRDGVFTRGKKRGRKAKIVVPHIVNEDAVPQHPHEVEALKDVQEKFRKLQREKVQELQEEVVPTVVTNTVGDTLYKREMARQKAHTGSKNMTPITSLGLVPDELYQSHVRKTVSDIVNQGPDVSYFDKTIRYSINIDFFFFFFIEHDEGKPDGARGKTSTRDISSSGLGTGTYHSQSCTVVRGRTAL